MGEELEHFEYRPECLVPGCPAPARYKIAAAWSDGTSRELKNYGTVCETHHLVQLEAARARRKNLHLAEGESVGEIELYRLVPGERDGNLIRDQNR